MHKGGIISASNYILILMVALLSLPVKAAPLSPADRDTIQQQQQQLLIQNQQQRDELERSIPLPAPTRPQPATQDSGPCFTIHTITLSGATVIAEKARKRLVEPWLNRCLDQVKINELTTHISDWYISRGYITSRAFLTEQDLSHGQLNIVVLEGKLEAIRLEGKTPLMLKMAFPGRTGRILNLRDIEQGMEQINRLRAEPVQIDILPGSQPEYSVVNLTAKPEFPLRATISLDNSGQESTGENQLNGALYANNILGLADQWFISGGRSSDFATRYDAQNFQAGVSLPFGYGLLDYSYAWSNYRTTLDNMGFDWISAGDTKTHRVNASWVVYRNGDIKTGLAAGVVQRSSRNWLNDAPLQSSTRNLSSLILGITHTQKLAGGVATFNPTWSHGMPWFNAETDEDKTGDEPRAEFRKWSLNASFQRPLTNNLWWLTSASQDKMKSTFDSVQEQTGLFAGDGGFDVTVGRHTQLDGAVIASTATADKNSLDTGTLGFSDLHNEADYKVSHTGVSLSGGGSFGDTFKGNLPGGMIAAAGSSGHAEGTTQAAVADGTITVRDKANQQQDLANLSRDTVNANDSISPIFDKEKEQNRLKAVGLISDIGSQAADIARTQGDIYALEAAKKKMAPLKANATEKERQDYVAALRNSPTYQKEMKSFGTGSELQRGIQAATAALQGLAGGNVAGALAGASAPELAHLIKSTEEDPAVNTLAHAILGGAVAALQGNNAAAGAMGAAAGELAAKAIIATMYPGKSVNDLNESEMQTVSTLASISAGMAGGLVGNSTASVGAGAQAGKNAVENNSLSADQSLSFDKELSDCRKSSGDCQSVIDKWKAISDKQSTETDQKLKDSPLEAQVWDKEVAQGGIDMAERPGWIGNIPGVDVMTSNEAKTYVQQWNGQDLANIDVNSPDWTKFAAFVSDPENQAAVASLGMLGKDLVYLAKTTISNLVQGGASTGIKSMQVGLRNPQQVDQIKNDMTSGNYRFTAPEGRIAGYIDGKGNYYISEGNHRMVAAQEIYKKTGDRSYIEKLLQNGSWTQTKNAPTGAKPMPTRK